MPNIKKVASDQVRRAYIPPDLTYATMSQLGRDIADLSRAIEESGEALLNEEEIELELARRRGGYTSEDAD